LKFTCPAVNRRIIFNPTTKYLEMPDVIYALLKNNIFPAENS